MNVEELYQGEVLCEGEYQLPPVLASNLESLRKQASEYGTTLEEVLEAVNTEMRESLGLSLPPNTSYVVVYGLHTLENLSRDV